MAVETRRLRCGEQTLRELMKTKIIPEGNAYDRH
jgi:hypothetical protein